MIVEYIRYRIPQDRAEAFEAAYARAAGPLAAAPHCVDFELSRCAEEPGHYILRITWTSLEGHLKGFRGGAHFPPFLAEIRPYAEDIEEMRHYAPTAVRGKGASVPSLYAWAGGADAIGRLTEAFYLRVRKDDVLAPVFADMSPDHPEHVALWLGEVFGGPPAYSEDHGGYPAMLGHHLDRALTETQRERWVILLMRAADEVGLPADPEFRSAFAAYVEWGTRIALANSQPGVKPPPRAPVPRWGWGEAPPYQP